MMIRFKQHYDNGTISARPGDTTGLLAPVLAARLVRSGLAEEVEGNEGLNLARAEAGMEPIARPVAKPVRKAPVRKAKK